MLATVQPEDGSGMGSSNAANYGLGENVHRTRVDSAHVVDGDGRIHRVPKLAVRNKVSDENNGVKQAAAPNSEAGSENEGSAPASSNSSQRVRTPVSNRSLSDESVNQTRWPASQRQSADSTKIVNAAAQSAKQKKRGGMLNFLTLKEPSTAAWAEFAEAEREKAKQKGVSVLGSGAHKPSSQKLPGHVPKVNSKWDGLPDSARRKSMDSKRANRASMMSAATRDTTWTATSTASGNSKVAKRAGATLSGRRVRDSMQSNATSASGRASSSRGSGKQPPALALDFETEPVEITNENRPQTFLRDPSPQTQNQYISQPSRPLSPPELEGDEIPYLQELDASAPNSPRTPPGDGSETRPALVGIHYPELDSIAKEAELFNDRKQEAVVRANSSRRPINFSRPQLKKPSSRTLQVQTEPIPERSTSALSQTDSIVLSPTLKTRNGKIEPFLTDTFASHSRETGHIPQRVASTLLKETIRPVSEPEPEEEEDEETPVSPISPLDPEFQHSSGPSIPDVTMRPPTATSIDTAVQDPDRAALESRSQLSLVNSVAPSELSEQWRMSPKERLGLGSKIRRSDALPWEGQEGGGMEGLSPAPQQESVMRRLSWRLSARK